MRELTIVAFSLASSFFLIWATGAWFWFAQLSSRWPWLIQRYVILFPALLFVATLALRRWSPARSTIGFAALGGTVIGFLLSLLTLFVAQAITVEDRELLFNVWKLGLEGVVGFLFLQVSGALFLSLGWLHGATTAVIAVLVGRTLRRLNPSRGQEVLG